MIRVSEWTPVLPQTEGYYLWYEPGSGPSPCGGLVAIRECRPGVGWPAGNTHLHAVGACQPTLMQGLACLWARIDGLSLRRDT